MSQHPQPQPQPQPQRPPSLVIDEHTSPLPLSPSEESQILAAEQTYLAPLLPALSAAYATGPVATLCDAVLALDKTGYFGGALNGRTIIRLYAAEHRQFYEWPPVRMGEEGGGLFGNGGAGEGDEAPMMVFVVYGEEGRAVVWVRDEGLLDGDGRPEEMLRGLFRGLAQVRTWMRKGRRVEVQWGEP